MADQLQEAYQKTAEAFHAWHEARREKAPECAKLDRLAQEACSRSTSLREQCRRAFADSRGWRYNPKTPAYLYSDPTDVYSASGDTFIDCLTEMYDSLDQRNVGLVVHTFSTPIEIADYGARHGYRVEILPFSWQSPRLLRAAVFTLKSGSAWPVPAPRER